MSEGVVTIAKDREKPVRNQHPWIFSGAIARVKGARDGEIVTVLDSHGEFLARGYYNHRSQIQVRLLTWQDEKIDEGWWRARVQAAIDLRQPLAAAGGHAAFRLINAENDFIPGLVVDRYGDWLVLQAQTLFIDDIKSDVARLMMEMTGARGVYERSDIEARAKEGLREVVGMIAGEEPPARIAIVEDGATYEVDVHTGHKTGFYLDQRDNRRHLAQLLARQSSPARVLNLFSYTGGFAVAALSAGVAIDAIDNVDSSEDALALAADNIARAQAGHAAQVPNRFVPADAFTFLRECVQQGVTYDVIVCDPPKFAHSAQQIDRAARGYKDLNLHAFRLIAPGGCLMTFSCSGAISRDLFQKIVFGALADSGRRAQIVAHLGAGSDHPVALTFPEGEYLKGLLVRVL
jgi:23S rRNA (cytosine1962-C5)-methyltransferase